MKLEPKITELLYNRGIRSEEEIREFLSDRPQKTHDPFLLHNMEAGVDLILSAIEDDCRICIYGDYDADGITSTVVMMEVLSHLTDNLMYYIPSRFEEGYGLNMDAIDKIASMGADMIITVDCGSVSCEEVEHARELGLRILVTDHHTVTDRIADCIVINPNQPDCNYPCPYLAGCGVAFKVAQAIVMTTGLPRSVLTRTLDMVGIGTIGDIVPLVDENRTLAKYGLRAINTGERKNLNRLIEAVGLHPGKIRSENVSFVIVPHLNAAGRMEHASLAVETFLTEDEETLDADIARLCACNNQRKKIQEETFQECVDVIDQSHRDDRFLVILLEHAHEGITGIVAGKVKERYNLPAVIVSPTGEGELKGTGRSIDGINLYEQLKLNEEYFSRFGGHAAACGFTMKREFLEPLRRNLENQMENVDPKVFQKEIRPDLLLEPEDLTLELAEQLTLLEPFGCGNERPVMGIRARGEDFRRIGSNGQFLRLLAVMPDGTRIPCVAFQDADGIELAFRRAGDRPVLILGTLETNTWNGRTTLQMILQGIKGE